MRFVAWTCFFLALGRGTLAVEPVDLSPADREAFRKAEIWCSTTEFLSSATSGGEGLRFEMTCLVPPALKPLAEGRDAAALVRGLSDRDARYVAGAALAALGRLHQLPGPERMRFTLELARREHEPFASARVAFEFRDRASWKGVTEESKNEAGRTRRPLAILPAPFEREMTAVIREYLSPRGAAAKPSTLACYLASIMGDILGSEAAPDLQGIVNRDAKSFEAGFAREALANLEEAGRFAKGTFDFDARIGEVSRRKNGCIVLHLVGKVPRAGNSVAVVRMGKPQTVAPARVVSAPACLESTPGNVVGSEVVLSLEEIVLDAGEVAIGIVAPPGKVEVRDGAAQVDLDRDGTVEQFRSCTSSEGVHLTVWAGKPLDGKRRWHDYHYLGYDVEPSCQEIDTAP